MSRKTTNHWDPVLIISQIVCLQTLHYLTLSVLIPPLLSLLAEPKSLSYEGGAMNVGMIMDWREMAGRPTVRGMQGGERWRTYAGAWSGGKLVGHGLAEDHWDGRIDGVRGWTIAFCWMIASSADIYYLYMLIRRPRMILDFAVTLVFNHLVLTTYYSATIPTSLFFYAILIAGCALSVIVGEQMCVKREMQQGLAVVNPENDEIEMAGLDREE